MPGMVLDQQGAEFLGQLKNFARGLLSWVQEEGEEEEHPSGDDMQGGSSMPIPGASDGALVRTRMTTVHDYAPGPGEATPPGTPMGAGGQPAGAVTTDPPVSQAQRGAMHAAAGGNSTIGIPQNVGQKFANADPGGSLPQKVNDADPNSLASRFSLSPDGSCIVDSQSGKQFPIKDVLQAVLQGTGTQAQPQHQDAAGISVNKPGEVNVAAPATPSGKWSMPPMKVNAAPGGAAPTTTTRNTSRDGLGTAIVHGATKAINTANRIAGPDDMPAQKGGGGEGGKALGRLLKYTSGDCGDGGGWQSPKFPEAKDAGTSEGAKKAAQTRGHGGGPAPTPNWKPRDQSKAGFGGAYAAKNYPEGFVQGVGPSGGSSGSSAGQSPVPKPQQATPRPQAQAQTPRPQAPPPRNGGGAATASGGSTAWKPREVNRNFSGYDKGTSEGAKKAAQTRKTGGPGRTNYPHGVMSGGAGGKNKPPQSPSPYRGYDSGKNTAADGGPGSGPHKGGGSGTHPETISHWGNRYTPTGNTKTHESGAHLAEYTMREGFSHPQGEHRIWHNGSTGKIMNPRPVPRR